MTTTPPPPVPVDDPQSKSRLLSEEAALPDPPPEENFDFEFSEIFSWTFLTISLAEVGTVFEILPPNEARELGSPFGKLLLKSFWFDICNLFALLFMSNKWPFFWIRLTYYMI